MKKISVLPVALAAFFIVSFVFTSCRSDPPPVEEPPPEPSCLPESLREAEQVLCPFEFEPNEFELRVFELTNRVRATHRLPPLIWCDLAACVARGHSMDMLYNNFMRHTGSDGSSIRERLERVGIENMRGGSASIAGGWLTPEEVVQAWMDSPRYRPNLLSRDFTHVGVGFFQRPQDSNARFATYWTQNFFVLE